ncbi:hypothetical protein DFH09DRAFT_1273244 [Mycena vulgaris]|nr:hypothetical protein DFH09DRAFT_1273244 [Mycena vulgaris]
MAEEAGLMLATNPWGIAKPAGLSDTELFHTIWRFVGPNWLVGSQMNDMFELLRYKIYSSPDQMKKIRICGTALAAKLISAHRSAESDKYWTAHDFRWLREVGDDLVQNRAALIATAHLEDIPNEPHWMGVVRYGESFGTAIPEELLAACRWWLGHHTPGEIGLEDLPIGKQTGEFSCGIFSGPRTRTPRRSEHCSGQESLFTDSIARSF